MGSRRSVQAGVIANARACAMSRASIRREHPATGTIRMAGLPVKLSQIPGVVRTAAPMLGQHSTEVLRESGYSQAEIEKLRESRVIGTGSEYYLFRNRRVDAGRSVKREQRGQFADTRRQLDGKQECYQLSRMRGASERLDILG